MVVLSTPFWEFLKQRVEDEINKLKEEIFLLPFGSFSDGVELTVTCNGKRYTFYSLLGVSF